MSNGAKIAALVSVLLVTLAALAFVLSVILACWCMYAGKGESVEAYWHQAAIYGYITYILIKIES